MEKLPSLKPARRAIRRARTERVVKSRMKVLKNFESVFKDPLTGDFRFPLPAPGTLASEGPYGGCSKAKMCPCSKGPVPVKDRLIAQTEKEELKQL